MYKNLKMFFSLLFRILDKSNLNKIISIFIYRVSIKNINKINTFFSDYLSQSSVIFSLFSSLFIVIINKLINYYHINNITSCVFNFYAFYY